MSTRQKIRCLLVLLIMVGVGSKSLNAQIIVNPSNGHAYEFIGEKLSWFDARDAAAASIFMGEHGYLSTITSQEEQDFLLDNFYVGTQGWLGGSDASQEGVWKWVVGPESGQTFWIGGSVAVGGYPVAYANWRSNQPSNEGGIEDYLVWRQDEQMKWNDLSSHADLGGYYVEYSVPEPTSIALLGAGVFILRRKIK